MGAGWVYMRILRGGERGDVGVEDSFGVGFAPPGVGKGIVAGRIDAIRYEELRGLFLKG